MSERFIGIDLGAEAIKVVELVREGTELGWVGRVAAEHHKEPGSVLLDLLRELQWDDVDGAAVVGRTSRTVRLPRIPTKQAQGSGFRFLFGDGPATVVSIGSHGFSVLELRDSGAEIFRENSRCSQGTGNFLCQLVERFDLSIEEADALCADVADPAPLSGRCPVILKTDMTHLANKGGDRAKILAGLYDAVCENVQVLIKPSGQPRAGRADRRCQHVPACAERQLPAIDRTKRHDAARHRGDDGLFVEALGAAVVAAERPARGPGAGSRSGARRTRSHLDRMPALGHLPAARGEP